MTQFWFHNNRQVIILPTDSIKITLNFNVQRDNLCRIHVHSLNANFQQLSVISDNFNQNFGNIMLHTSLLDIISQSNLQDNQLLQNNRTSHSAKSCLL